MDIAAEGMYGVAHRVKTSGFILGEWEGVSHEAMDEHRHGLRSA